ncbi:hypothetical protein ATO10_00685 [Actibacterium atlanticum]|uniref:Phosphoadenosine phosphosulfate reductase n=1 Tax=Actibacterium atlanticum TaxID=1461693 RepID=A0A058ZQ18_9RHOB|nr:hypothetical protein [Actibacterium atlanticum]KCV83232.1 hypothetical protein ATO10_00685 [Actibacterium atlanticum]
MVREEHIKQAPWFQRLHQVGDDRGYFETLGTDHAAIFIDETPTLLVSFETTDGFSDDADAMPLAYDLAEDAGWSMLTVLTNGDTWFRDPAVYAFFDRLVDDGFFEDFDRVVFYGAGMCGYAACAFSVSAPGATVISIAPQATLDPRVTEWDERFTQHRRIDFTSRYGYAPDMLEAAHHAFILYDPYMQMDAVHAALFTRPNVTKLRCRWFESDLETDLNKMGVLPELIDAACEDTLTEDVFHRLFRTRRRYKPYLRRMANGLEKRERPYLNALLCHNVSSRLRAPLFRKKMRQSAETLAEAGPLPAWLEEALSDES